MNNKKINALADIDSLLLRDKILYIDTCIDSYCKNKGLDEMKIADLGSGVGKIVLPLARLGHKIDAYELNKDSLNILKNKLNQENLQDNITAINCAIESMDSKKKYNVVTLIEVLEHTSQPLQILNLINSLLETGGLLILTIPNGFGPLELFVTRPAKWFRKIFNINKPEGYHHLQFFSFGKLKKIINQAGFTIEGFKKTSFFPYFPFLNKIKFLQRIDIALARIMPVSLVNGWYFKCIKK